MRKRNSYYYADKGKQFVLTQKGKDNCKSYAGGVVGEPVDDKYPEEAVWWAVEDGYVEEKDIPDWCTMTGYEVVYDNNGVPLSAGNPQIFPTREIAESYKSNYQKHPWFHSTLYIREKTYEGRALKDCRMYEGKIVYNDSYYCGVSALQIGDFVEKDIVDSLMDCCMPISMSLSCSQMGEAANHKIDDRKGKVRATYATFKEVAKDTWQYCGECFAHETTPRGIDLPVA